MRFEDLYSTPLEDFVPLLSPPEFDTTVTEQEIDGGVRVIAVWEGAGRLKMDCFPERVVYQALDLTEPHRGEGVFTWLVARHPDFFWGLGVKTFEASAGGVAAHIAQLMGFQETEPGWLVHRLGKRCRMNQYTAWKQGEQDEPGWHSDLAGATDVISIRAK